MHSIQSLQKIISPSSYLHFPSYSKNFRSQGLEDQSWLLPSKFEVSVSFWSQTILHFLAFDIFSTVHHSIELFHQPTLMRNFLYSLTIYLLHYYPRHVSSINMPILRRKNFIHTASDIFTLCKRLHSTHSQPVYCADVYRERRYQMLCEYNFLPEDGHVNARNVLRIIV